MEQLRQTIKHEYRWVLFDTPPLLPVADATLLGRNCTGIILVVRMAQTPRTVIRRVQELLAEQRLPVLGCVLNDLKETSKENNYYYGYYSEKSREDGYHS